MKRNDIEKLQSISDYPCISIFVPTHRTMPARQQDPVRVKDLIGKAVERLKTEFSTRDILPFVQALDQVAENIDYENLLDGLAIFVNKNISQVHVLPFGVNEKVVIDNTFATKDLLLAFAKNPSYWVLALSKSPTRLFEGAGNTLLEVLDPVQEQNNQTGFPFKWQWQVTNDSKLEAVSSGDLSAGYLTDLKKQFYDQVDLALDKHLKHHDDSWPLIVLGVTENTGEFLKVTKHKKSIVGVGSGDFAHSTVEQVATKAWPLMQTYLDQEKAAAVSLFKEAIGTPEHTYGLENVWKKAIAGQVRILLVEENYQVPGIPDINAPEKLVIYKKSDMPRIQDDLIDTTMQMVLSKRGKVVFVNKDALKDYERIGAILRYS